ncbi:hypothetical protein SAMN05720468_1087 [Fibrobacter sp. UWEL]|nr:hypothetical protein SAMN05720468_1087 [Fibrobacter sp. UWEL]
MKKLQPESWSFSFYKPLRIDFAEFVKARSFDFAQDDVGNDVPSRMTALINR